VRADIAVCAPAVRYMPDISPSCTCRFKNVSGACFIIARGLSGSQSTWNSIGNAPRIQACAVHCKPLQPLTQLPVTPKPVSQISSSARVFGVLSAPAVKAKGLSHPFGIFFGIVEFGALHWRSSARLTDQPRTPTTSSVARLPEKVDWVLDRPAVQNDRTRLIRSSGRRPGSDEKAAPSPGTKTSRSPKKAAGPGPLFSVALTASG